MSKKNDFKMLLDSGDDGLGGNQKSSIIDGLMRNSSSTISSTVETNSISNENEFRSAKQQVLQTGPPTFEESHRRTSVLLEIDVFDALNEVKKKHKRGFQTRLINTALRNALIEIGALDRRP